MNRCTGQIALALSCLSISLTAIGCSRQPSVVEVSGVLTYQGKPVPNMLITFKPETGRPSWGQTDGEGKFTLNYSKTIPKGALLSKHTVWLTRGAGLPSQETSPEQYAADVAGGDIDQADEIPSKYFSEKNTTIEITIKESTENLVVDLD